MTEKLKRVVISGLQVYWRHSGGLAATGARIALIDLATEARDIEKSCWRTHFFLGGVDLTNFTEAQRVMDAAASKLGGIDTLVTRRRRFSLGARVADGTPDTWDFLYRINLRTAMCASKAALPYMSGPGSIINIAAAAAAKAAIGMGAYAASKAGVLSSPRLWQTR